MQHPSLSLIKRICYPELCKFSTCAVIYGRDNESTALKRYTSKMAKKHVNLKLLNVGLIVNNAFPHVGASPDAIVECDCCGNGTVEVKCPYSLRNSPTLNALYKDSSSSLLMLMLMVCFK